MEELDATRLLSCLGVADASLWHPVLASCLPLSLSRRLKMSPVKVRGGLTARFLPGSPTSIPAHCLVLGRSRTLGVCGVRVCVCVQNRAVESRLSVLCQDITVHRELNAGNIGGPWASLLHPLVSLEQRRNSQEELLGGGHQRNRFSSSSQSHQPLKAAPTGAILSSHIALINYNPSFSISPPRD